MTWSDDRVLVMPWTTTGRTVGQTSHQLVRDALRQAVQTGPGALDRIGWLRYRASAVLYLLLLDHPIDRRGRCRSCRRPSAMITFRRRPCQILINADYWLLRQPDEARLFSRISATTTPAGRRSSERHPTLAPGGQPDPNQQTTACDMTAGR